jgi:Ca-activated chloride channel homolog
VRKVCLGAALTALISCQTALAAQSPASVQSEQALPTFKSAVEAVPISAIVRDRRGRMVTTLTAGDFQVLDKGERRTILDFQTDQSSPITLAILVDTSGSMRVGAKLAFAREVLKRMAADLQDGRDEVSLFTFDAGLHEQQPFTAHPAVLLGALDGADPFGVTSLYDAIAETARRLSKRPAQRRAVVVITDGLDTASELTAPEVSGLASSIDAPVYIVATVPPIDYATQADRAAASLPRFSADLKDLATWTGGDLLWVTAPEEAALQTRQIVSELRHQYLITIEPAADQDWRPIDVRVRDRRMTVRARSGYFGSRTGASR